MMPSIYCIPVDTAGRLYIMPKPSGEWLEDDLQQLRLSGVDRIVSMLMPSEARDLGLADEREVCRSLGLDYTNVPVPDRGLPTFKAAGSIASSIQIDLHAGRSVAVHCRAGIGRSGLVCCCALINLGILADNALERVSTARGINVPDTEEQREFVRAFYDGSMRDQC